jgi:ABC-type cobalamin/Fe3+-siderophores transport system ATPase subunit
MVIKIFGSKAEGKSTILELLEKTLKEHNFEVETEDIGDKPTMPLEERLEIMGSDKGPLKVEIKVIPYTRETRPQYAQEFKP